MLVVLSVSHGLPVCKLQLARVHRVSDRQTSVYSPDPAFEDKTITASPNVRGEAALPSKPHLLRQLLYPLTRFWRPPADHNRDAEASRGPIGQIPIALGNRVSFDFLRFRLSALATFALFEPVVRSVV
jgi:hypothetical protein